MCLGAFATLASADDPSTDVPLFHGVYQVIDRFDARGWLNRPVSATRPYSRYQVCRLLWQIHEHTQTGHVLTRTEQALLSRYLAEFDQDLRSLGFDRLSPPQKRGAWTRALDGLLFGWQDSAAAVAVAPVFRQRLVQERGNGSSDETVSQTYVGGLLRGTYRNHLGFRVRHFEAREWSTRLRTSRQDVLAHPIEAVQLKGKTVDFREATFQVVCATPWFDLDLGKASLDWGPGRMGNLFLTNNAPSFGMIRLKASHGPATFTHIGGFLRARPGLIDSIGSRVDNGHSRTLPRPKHLAAHRLELALSKGIVLGLQEAVVYGDRAPEFLYLCPAAVLIAAQSYLGDTDNLAVGVDLSVRLPQNLQVHLALFLDDINKFSPGAFSNKYAVQVGLFWVDPLGLPDSDLRIEYVRLEPFVYSHHFDINTYEHFDAPLGHPLGPNADRISGQIAHRLSPSLSLSLDLQRERQGENFLNADGNLVNVGGDAEQGRRPADPEVKRFLSGVVETRTELGAGLTCQPTAALRLNLHYRTVAAGNILLSEKQRGNARHHTWSFTLDLNFF